MKKFMKENSVQTLPLPEMSYATNIERAPEKQHARSSMISRKQRNAQQIDELVGLADQFLFG